MEENQVPQESIVPKWKEENEKRDLTWKSKYIDKISKALCEAQKNMNGVLKNAKGYNLEYADLHAVINATIPLLN